MIQVDIEPCAAYLDWQQTKGAFFDGAEWGNILRMGLGAHPRYIWDSTGHHGHLLLLLRRGPISIGYLGFPICADPDADTMPYALDSMVKWLRTSRYCPQLLRIPLSAFSRQTFCEAGKNRPLLESCIEDLPAWRLNATAERRRYLSVAQRRCANFTEILPQAAALNSLYRSAVARNHGRLRYTCSYFERLSAVANEHIRIHSRSENGNAIGMIITAKHGDTVYYLHGGTDRAAMGSGVADLLMAEAIETAQARGARRFNFLSSPLNQPGLVRFKQKWGGVSRPAATIDLPMDLVGQLLARLL